MDFNIMPVNFELNRFLKFGYFPKELPPPFTTIPFGEFVCNNAVPLIDKYISRPCLHNLARPGNQRRILSVPHPINQILLSKLLVTNSNTINLLLDRSKISLSKPKIDATDFRAYVQETEGNELQFHRAKIRAGARFVVRADVSRFYHTIYTHSIPWATIGKSEAKKNRNAGFGNELDKYLRNSQDGQTLGIPVGPDTSFIISEIICSSIDAELQEKLSKSFRFVDDFEFTFSNRKDAEQALPILESALSSYELALNPLKSQVDQLPVLFETSWRSKIKSYHFPDVISGSVLVEYFDLMFEQHAFYKTEPVLRYGIARLRSIVSFQDEELLVDLLLQCILIEPGTLQEVLYLIETSKIKLPRKKMTAIIRDLISHHAPMMHGSEVAWALWCAIYNAIKIPDSASKALENLDDSIIALLSLHAHEKKLISSKVKSYWQHLMTKESLEDGHWLLAYEADLKGWLSTSDTANHINSNEFFKLLKKNEISFYDQSIDYAVSKAEISDTYNTPDGEDESNDDEDSDDDTDEDDLPF